MFRVGWVKARNPRTLNIPDLQQARFCPRVPVCGPAGASLRDFVALHKGVYACAVVVIVPSPRCGRGQLRVSAQRMGEGATQRSLPWAPSPFLMWNPLSCPLPSELGFTRVRPL